VNNVFDINSRVNVFVSYFFKAFHIVHIFKGSIFIFKRIFVYITKLILCKIFDENETIPGAEYEFQRYGDAAEPESASDLSARMNALYKRAETAYLALPVPSEGPAFDLTRISPEKIAYVVGRIESISVIRNNYPGDLLGEFFEQIVSQDFTQSKGQFFTPPKIVRFMLYLADVVGRAKHVMQHEPDHQGRPRLPYILDPSCGSGTILIEYMKLIRDSLATDEIVDTLPNRLRAEHATWFTGQSGNKWAKDYIFGVEYNYDLALAAKVNMVLHGDGSMNTWIKSGLLPFKNYWVNLRHTLLGVEKESGTAADYPCPTNEEFDLVISNPPFSIMMSPDEKRLVESAFSGLVNLSETLFVERWYQVLRPGGVFCCVLPEAVLDTKNNSKARNFIAKYFRIKAVVSLPYQSFRPFTSTKTSIVLCEKRSHEEVLAYNRTLAKLKKTAKKNTPEHELLATTFRVLEWADDPIFFAEPVNVGYRRRKNLPDLLDINKLYQEDANGKLRESNPANPTTVLDKYLAGPNGTPDSEMGFWSNLGNIFSRNHYRFDPKYRWLWDFQKGIVFGDEASAKSLSEYLEVKKLEKIAKGDLEDEVPLIDLELVAARQATLLSVPPEVDQLGSERVSFSGVKLVFSKLEPYLGKMIVDPPENGVGSPEWVGLSLKQGIDQHTMAYFLMLPQMCEAYRRLQSGKRHARLDPTEMLELRVVLPPNMIELTEVIQKKRDQVIDLTRQQREVRMGIDDLFAAEVPIDPEPMQTEGKGPNEPESS